MLSRHARLLPERAAPFALYAVCLTLAILVIGTGIDRLSRAVLNHAGQAVPPAGATAAAATTEVVRTARLIPTNDDWNEKIRDPAFWAKLRGGSAKPAGWTRPETNQRSNLGINEWLLPLASPALSRRAKAVALSDGDDTFRTVCVRLCDGSFSPLSFATSRDNFDTDAARCANSCGGQARMFFYKNPGGDPADMEDLTGQPYKRLPNAFLYKTKYVEACKCRPHPWEDAALDRHKVYALEAQLAKGNKTAAADLRDLRSKLQQTEADAVAERTRAIQARAAEQKRLAEDARAAKLAARSAAAAERLAAKAEATGGSPPPRLAIANVSGPVPLQSSVPQSLPRVTVLAPNGTQLAVKAQMSQSPIAAARSFPLKHNLTGVVTVVSDRALRTYPIGADRYQGVAVTLRPAQQSRPLYAR